MSEENVERLRAFFEDWARRPWTPDSGPDDLDLSLFAVDVVYEDTALPDHLGEEYRGPDGVLRAASRWFEPFERLEIELQRIVGSGDRLVSICRVRMKAHRTGIEFDASLAYAWTFRDGKVVHFKSFRDPEEALAAAGLSG